MKLSLASAFLALACVTAGQLGCSVIVGADFDVFLRKKDASSDGPALDAAMPNDAGAGTDGAPDAAQDAASRSDAPDAGSNADRIDSGTDANDSDQTDGEAPDVLDDGSDAGDDASDGNGGGGTDASDAPDVPQPEPRPEGGIGPTVVRGNFVGTGVPAQSASGIELRGHIISSGMIGGSTAGGISIEGRFR